VAIAPAADAFSRRRGGRRMRHRGASETSEPGNHRSAVRAEKWIPGSMLSHRPGM